MRFVRPKKKRSRLADLTPLVDVVLQLIIFFMVTSQFSKMVRSEVELPKESGIEEVEKPPDTLVIDVAANGDFIIESRAIDRANLIAKLRAEIVKRGNPEAVELLIRGDAAALTETLNTLAGDLRSLGIRSWRIGTERPRGGR